MSDKILSLITAISDISLIEPKIFLIDLEISPIELSISQKIRYM